MERSFVYQEGSKIVFCERCGALAGAPTECPRYSSHSFVSTDAPVVCEHCGAVPGPPSDCPRYSSHDFREVR